MQDKSDVRDEYKAEGRFTKACAALSMGCDMIQVGKRQKTFSSQSCVIKTKFFQKIESESLNTSQTLSLG